jgi:Protein of unknown function (DUF429)
VAGEADIFLGFDPGGGRKFGVALVQGSNVRVATQSGIAAALSWARSECKAATPVAAGIDSLLHWSTGATGWRDADEWLRTKYPDVRSSVVSPNALYGAMTIGGMGLAIELRRTWPAIRLNETHPKVLFRALRGKRYVLRQLSDAVQWFASHSKVDLADRIDDDHQFDALLSAWATREGYTQGWQDLAEPRADHIFPAGKVNYLWPLQ